MKLVLIAATAAVAMPAHAAEKCQDVPATYETRNVYFACIKTQARLMEPSRESARDIASAAFSICQPQRRAMQEAFLTCTSIESWSNIIEPKLHAFLTDDAIAEVVKIRAKRPKGAR